MRVPPRVRGGLRTRLFVLLVGLVLFAMGVVALLESKLGLAPWDVLHQGIAKHSPLTLGTASITVSVIVLVVARIAGARLGIGSVANAVLVGAFIQAFTSIGPVADLAHARLPFRIVVLAVGLLCFGIGTALYIGASLGAGPRDSLMVVGAQRTPLRIGAVRAVLEGCALVAGFALGGKVGVGTLAFAILIGPMVEIGFWLLDRSPLVASV
jgi:uncharacterized membrane protein YczE